MARRVFASLLTVSVLLFAGSAIGDPTAQIGPRHDSNAPRPEAADQNLGMAILSAAVKGDGTLLSGAGVVSSEKTDVGAYLVVFNRSLVGCQHVASLSSVNAIWNNQLSISSASEWGADKEIFVQTFYNNAAKDSFFEVLVFCPK